MFSSRPPALNSCTACCATSAAHAASNALKVPQGPGPMESLKPEKRGNEVELSNINMDNLWFPKENDLQIRVFPYLC